MEYHDFDCLYLMNVCRLVPNAYLTEFRVSFISFSHRDFQIHIATVLTWQHTCLDTSFRCYRTQAHTWLHSYKVTLATEFMNIYMHPLANLEFVNEKKAKLPIVVPTRCTVFDSIQSMHPFDVLRHKESITS